MNNLKPVKSKLKKLKNRRKIEKHGKQSKMTWKLEKSRKIGRQTNRNLKKFKSLN